MLTKPALLKAVIGIMFLQDCAECVLSQCQSGKRNRQHHKNSGNIYLEYKTGVINVPVKMHESREEPLPVSISDTVPLSMRLPFEVDPVAGINVQCKSKEFRTQLREVRRKIKCTPRPMIVDVVSTEGKVIPNKILTKQCTGWCSGKKVCISDATINISLSVQVILDNRRIKCARILVREDKKCRCGCEEPKKPCTSVQIFDDRNCKCVCANNKEYTHCLRKINMTKLHKWNFDTCLCECSSELPCTTGTLWDKTHCRCVREKEV
ncbi:balbiani ring protein 3-like isoform X2 [Cylas formicarius]|uniref:balbiani ring protein 3-like isoform X2 n=1 Tax=Cylas formicarius TaxID=197179 RepID=UPI0029589174|nr:balbiani ring protein 3-like isoform X2 [Cylas formicarius]